MRIARVWIGPRRRKAHLVQGGRRRHAWRIRLRTCSEIAEIGKLQSRDGVQLHQIIRDREVLPKDCIPLVPVEVEVRIHHRRWGGD